MYSKVRERGWIVMYVLVAILVTFGGIGSRQARASGTNDTWSNSFYRNVLACGPNALFIFLVLSGHSEVTLERLWDIPVSSDGASLLALSGAVRKFHIDVEIRLYRPEEVGRIPLPAIGQFKTSMDSITPFHFGVIYKVDSKRVYVLDGTTGFKQSFRRSRLHEFWTGYAMTEKRSLATRMMNQWQPALLAACLVIIDLITLAFWFRRRRCRETSIFTTEEEVLT